MKFKERPDYDKLRSHLDLQAVPPKQILFPKASQKRHEGFYTPRVASDT